MLVSDSHTLLITWPRRRSPLVLDRRLCPSSWSWFLTMQSSSIGLAQDYHVHIFYYCRQAHGDEGTMPAVEGVVH